MGGGQELGTGLILYTQRPPTHPLRPNIFMIHGHSPMMDERFLDYFKYIWGHILHEYLKKVTHGIEYRYYPRKTNIQIIRKADACRERSV